MLTIWGIFLVAAGILVGTLVPRLPPKILSGKAFGAAYLGAALVVLGAGMQIYEAWWKLPPQCRSVLSMSCDTSPAPKSKRR
jgi:hypothetical protein